MTALLWARPIFALILLALVGLNVWTACAADAKHERWSQPRPQPKNQQ